MLDINETPNGKIEDVRMCLLRAFVLYRMTDHKRNEVTKGELGVANVRTTINN